MQWPGQWAVHSSSMYYSSSPQADCAVVDVLTHCMMHFRPLQNLMMSLQWRDFVQPYMGQT